MAIKTNKTTEPTYNISAILQIYQKQYIYGWQTFHLKYQNRITKVWGDEFNLLLMSL